MAAVTLAVLWGRVISPLRWWTKPRTAAEIESRFPQLGQRIRTVVQYAGLPDERIHSEGVTPSLVDALEERDRDPGASAAARSGRALAAGLGRRGAGGRACTDPARRRGCGSGVANRTRAHTALSTGRTRRSRSTPGNLTVEQG